MEQYHSSHLCTVCGQKFDNHAMDNNPHAKLNACPGGNEFPSWPSSIKDENKAGLEYGRRIAKFWKASPGEFKPR